MGDSKKLGFIKEQKARGLLNMTVEIPLIGPLLISLFEYLLDINLKISYKIK